METGLASNSQLRTRLCLLNVGTKGVHHHYTQTKSLAIGQHLFTWTPCDSVEVLLTFKNLKNSILIN